MAFMYDIFGMFALVEEIRVRRVSTVVIPSAALEVKDTKSIDINALELRREISVIVLLRSLTYAFCYS